MIFSDNSCCHIDTLGVAELIDIILHSLIHFWITTIWFGRILKSIELHYHIWTLKISNLINWTCHIMNQFISTWELIRTKWFKLCFEMAHLFYFSHHKSSWYRWTVNPVVTYRLRFCCLGLSFYDSTNRSRTVKVFAFIQNVRCVCAFFTTIRIGRFAAQSLLTYWWNFQSAF